MDKMVIGNLIGILILLIGCCITFTGSMIPAMWQLTSLIWITYWSTECMDKDDKK